MPTYAYRCNTCDHAFDIYQQFSDASLTECPECGGKLRKVYGSLGITFNGSGFYRNDSRESAKTGDSSSGGSSSSDSSSSDSSSKSSQGDGASKSGASKSGDSKSGGSSSSSSSSGKGS